jgi:4-diphosphocytidyl-2-C-methyl-D-erythritol kinase
LIAFPNCKINLGLHIVAKRADGYHDLETVFYPVSFIRCPGNNSNFSDRKDPKLSLSGLKLESTPDANLCVRAYQLLKKDFPDLPLVEIFLHKNIPAGGGLGGGSADAAFMLSLLNEKFRLGIGEDRLLNYALQLGSDLPFFCCE